MECSVAREALSARLDGEAQAVPSARVDEHLTTCAGCRSWYDAAEQVTRQARLAPAPPVPDLTEQILAAAPAPRPARPIRLVWRVLLGIAAAAQIAVALAQAFGVDFGMTTMDGHPAPMATHLLNESTAWAVALGTGFLFAAARPATAEAMLAVAAAYLVVLGGYVTVDWVEDRLTAARLASHSVALIAVLVLVPVARSRRHTSASRPHEGRVSRRQSTESGSGTGGTGAATRGSAA
ncbi:zf-HC2 domain-containing protein [Nocardia sp. NBC_01377]|uniref:zf-HC2 domain-containing protein n=1 Tax=Nocardia sp. NBC_01377 TaxID=2903595 RepID=UPI00324E3C57